ncbi:MAG TPA: hypothetical protein V6C50_12100 [Crinalium sp.]
MDAEWKTGAACLSRAIFAGLKPPFWNIPFLELPEVLTLLYSLRDRALISH